MPGDLIGYGVSILGTLAIVSGGWLTYKVGKRTVRATERRDAHARDDALFARYERGWTAADARAEKLSEKVTALEERVEKHRSDQEERVRTLQEQVERLRAELERVKGWLDKLAAYIRQLLAWAATVTHEVPHPPIPNDIAHLIRPNEPAQGGTP